MPQWLPAVLSVVVAVVTITANAVIATKIKFAPDAKTAIRELKDLGLGIVRWVATLAVMVSLVYQVNTSEPLTRIDALLMMLNVAVLLFAVTIALILKIVDRVYRRLHEIYDLFEVQRQIDARHLAITDRVEGAVLVQKNDGPRT